ncbi:hypothetical protein DKX38_018815 [Salix brachista]|uniref:Uncharacterized protein n=1 Tax=Salix brachista TaxID=2182728 RepID=A0A5N5KP21_9ROSI|nr:hypothetical protein DKX38_018815 [Salix brachista]
MDAIDSVVDPLRGFAKDSVRLVKRCHKPDQKGGDSYCNRIRGYGVCWVLREVVWIIKRQSGRKLACNEEA